MCPKNTELRLKQIFNIPTDDINKKTLLYCAILLVRFM